MADVLITDQTRISVEQAAPIAPSRTRTIEDIVDEAGHLRRVSRLIGDDVVELHRQAFDVQLNVSANELAKRRLPKEMLEELADCGFAWRDIARMIGVSVPAVRRWRQSEAPTAAHLLAIARLVAFAELLRTDHMVIDVAAWMEMPIWHDVPISGIDLAVAGRYGDLLELAADHTTPEAVLDGLLPDWRERYRSEFEVFEAPDGELAIRLARNEQPSLES